MIELGPGGGAITDALHERLTTVDTLLAVERNPAMAAHLSTTRSWLKVIAGDAADLPSLAARAGHPRADLIISALPWSIIPDADQRNLLTAIINVLNPGGVLATVLTMPVLYLPIVRQLRRRLGESFTSVTHRTVWRNLPPARLYISRGPLSPGAR
ncbi:class I SAM-dependent methyltransferase [Actinoplanes flavus]|uniref:Methyltransferase domain-containing protein n=1 Tax=Actinoplanes flavus TaxID=2820290 RepID=A0ABS3UD81_9ACTN|nr:methyltransferase domain-containing protein [Actinoplanes flavus]MBO3736737.1 methyltransferase domain-containing protein [Actinoplanes flavus]